MSYGRPGHAFVTRFALPLTGRGLSIIEPSRSVVGVERFELPTSCSQSKRATRLRYTPKTMDYAIPGSAAANRPRRPCYAALTDAAILWLRYTPKNLNYRV